MITYSKFAPHVYLAKSPRELKRDEVIEVSTSKSTTHKCVVHNFIYEKSGFFYYSITREDGFNSQQHAGKSEYWKAHENDIDLSMPESIDYYAHVLERATARHAGLKNGSIPREHGLALQYAKKEVNDARNRYELALRLWSQPDA